MTLQVDADADLQPHNSMAVAARARYLVSVSTGDELRDALDFARARKLPYLILGEGSNIIFQRDYPGLVILNRFSGIQVVRESNDTIEIDVAAGENWHHLVEQSVRQGWFGLENLALIPGLVGAAPIQNIGAYGAEVKDVITGVRIFDTTIDDVRFLLNKDCEFEYRDSVFKHALNACIITSVRFRLSKIPQCNLSYPALANEVGEEPSPQEVFDAVCRIRSAKLPDPSVVPNTGSFFKNPIIGDEAYERLIQRYPALVAFKVDGGYKVAAGWLIEAAGWKEKDLDGVKVHSDQALVITNPNCRSGQHVMNYANAIHRDINTRFGIDLEIEPRVV